MLWLYASPFFEETKIFVPPSKCYLNETERKVFSRCTLCKTVANQTDPSLVFLEGDKWLSPCIAYLVGDMRSVESREIKLMIEMLGIDELEHICGSKVEKEIYDAVLEYLELCVLFGLCINKMFKPLKV